MDFLEGRDVSVMLGASPEWDALVDRWDFLVGLLEEEIDSGGRRAPKTFAAMREVLESARTGVRR